MLILVAAPVTVLPTYPNLVPPLWKIHTKFLSDTRTEPMPPFSPSLQRAFLSPCLQPLKTEKALTILPLVPCPSETGITDELRAVFVVLGAS